MSFFSYSNTRFYYYYHYINFLYLLTDVENIGVKSKNHSPKQFKKAPIILPYRQNSKCCFLKIAKITL